MSHKLPNNAYIDGANLFYSIQALGWAIDYKKLRIFFKLRYGVGNAYYVMGYVKKYEPLYAELKEAGFQLIFKPTLSDPSGEIKGNADAELVWKLARDDCAKNFLKAVVVTGDGDFTTVVRTLWEENKLRILLCPSRKSCSRLLKEHEREKPHYKIVFMEDLRTLIADEK